MGRAGDRLNAATSEAAALRESVDALVNTILSAAPQEDKRWFRATWLLIVGGPLLFALTAGLTLYTTTQTSRIESRLNHGIVCLLADLDDHRYTNQNAHDQLAAHDMVIIQQPDVKPLTPQQVDQLKPACDRFVHEILNEQAHRARR
jgi:hypothetical protein